MYCSSFDKIYDITAHHCLLWGHLRSLLQSKKERTMKGTMIISSSNLLSQSIRWKVLHFLLSRIKKVDCDFTYRQFFLICLPPVKPRDIAFIPSVLEGVQTWRASWIRSISQETAGRGKELTLSLQGGFIAWVHETLYAGYRFSPAKNNCNRQENHYY